MDPESEEAPVEPEFAVIRFYLDELHAIGLTPMPYPPPRGNDLTETCDLIKAYINCAVGDYGPMIIIARNDATNLDVGRIIRKMDPSEMVPDDQ